MKTPLVQFRCDSTPAERFRWVGGVRCLPGYERPLFDQLVRRMLGLSPADRVRWIEQCRPRRGPHRRKRK